MRAQIHMYFHHFGTGQKDFSIDFSSKPPRIKL